MTAESSLSTSWHSYPSIFNLGHRYVADIFSQPYVVQEKVDGSQFSFGVFDGLLRVKSKSKEMDPAAPEKLFARAVETVNRLAAEGLLRDGWTYRGEVLDTPRHNVLCYNRVPTGHIVLFDVSTGEESYLDQQHALPEEAARLGLEAVPFIFYSAANEPVTEFTIRNLLTRESFLGGQLIEGVVFKSLSLYGVDKKRLMAKFVSEAFKETHKKVWGEMKPSNGDVIDKLAAGLKTDARWAKAVLHLREQGVLADEPRDIPALLSEVKADIAKEETDAIKEALFKWAWPLLQKRLTAGFPEWYKALLLKQQFVPVAA